MDVAGEVRHIRGRLGLTQSALAERLGVSFVTVNRWENGKVRPAEPALRRLRALGQAAAASPAAESKPDKATLDFLGDAERVRLVVEAERLSYGHAASPAFATETSRIEPLPHQRIAVYEHMVPQPRLRFLLADDAGAGKTIMTGLYICEMEARRLIRRVLVVPPAGLVGNWQRELERLFGLSFRIVRGQDVKTGNPFVGTAGDRVICSVDTLAGDAVFSRLADPTAEPYDLVVFDEAHKLSSRRDPDLTVHRTDRYKLAEALAGAATEKKWTLRWSARHLLLLTATPHMGKDFPYFALWRLLEPETLPTEDAFKAFPVEERARRFLRRTKEEMVRFDGTPLYPQRQSDTLGFDLSAGPSSEQELYERTTEYMREFYNRAGILNQSAAQLALSVFQRRLASSTYALMRSFERRLQKLDEVIEQVREGRLTSEQIAVAQRNLEDPFDERTADEEAGVEGLEGHEREETRLLQLIRTTSLAELQAERSQVEGLLDLSRRVLASGHESKFETLREFILEPEYSGEKLIIFTEHRDTLDWLRQRLEAMGFTDQVAAIHGGLDYRQREEQVERFRRAKASGGAQYLLATDAAGEGINLQFCWLMVNYDVPWNPARLEQRMGRIHRYGQAHDPVVIANLVANNTREGLVIGTLLRKLESIRKAMRSDKVFDVVGRIFDNVPITRYVARALIDRNEKAVAAEIEGRLTKEQVEAIRDREQRLFGDGGDVKRELPRLRAATEHEALRRLLPGYVRQFVSGAADALSLAIEGNPDTVFSLRPLSAGAMDPLWGVLDRYPEGVRSRLTVNRPSAEDAVFLHPGEPVFEEVRRLVLDRFGGDAQRGAAFIDPTTTDPYVHLVAEIRLVRRRTAVSDSHPDETVESRLVGVRIGADRQPELCPVEHVLLLRGSERFPSEHVSIALRGTELSAAGEAFLQTRIAEPLVAERRHALMDALPERQAFLERGFDFQGAELAATRQNLTEKVRSGHTAMAPQLEAVKAQQRALDYQKAQAVAALVDEPGQLAVGHVRVLARMLVVPAQVEIDREQFDANVEAIAMQLARAYEEASGATVWDVSTPPKALAAGLSEYPGFDLLSRYPSGERREIEVKGRARVGDVDISRNEWGRACNQAEEYWLYIVFDCATAHPRLVRVQDPFSKLLARLRGVTVSVDDILAVGESGWVAPSTSGSALPDSLRPLFWDHDFDQLRWPVHRDLVIARVVGHGGEEATRWLRRTAGDPEIALWLTTHDGGGLEGRTLRFWQTVLDLPAHEVDRWVAKAKAGPWSQRG